MRKDSINVVHSKKLDKWRVFRGTNKSPSKVCATKKDAEAFARPFSRKCKMPLTLYNMDGTLSQRNSGQRRVVKVTAKKKPVQKKRVIARRKPVSRKRVVRRR